MITGLDVVDGLHFLGLDAGSTVVVHASLRSFGSVDGGAATVADALVSVCGTVVMPSGTWDLTGVPAPPGSERPHNAARSAESWEDFDAAVARAVPFSAHLPIDKGLGAIPEAMRLGHPHVRGRHPLFSFLAVGSHAGEVVAAERLDWPLGPIEAAADLGATVLLLGVDHTVNTAIHLAEQRLGRSRFYRYAKVGEGAWAEFPNVPGESHRFDDIEPALRAYTLEVTIGSCRARAIPLHDVLRVATEAVVEDAGALLCGDADCRCGAALNQRQM